MNEKLNAYSSAIAIIFLLIIFAAAFETFQQQYYIRRYAITENSSYFTLLYKQSLNWFIWGVLSIVIILFSRKEPISTPIYARQIGRYSILIIGLLIANLLLISFIRLVIINQQAFDSDTFWEEYIVFFAFQKTPIYMLGYIAVAIVFNLYFRNEELQFKMLQLSELKEKNEELYASLKGKFDDKMTLLSIKIGNKRKIISVQNILWIEADDYCAIIHTNNNASYTMRSTLKALDQKLDKHFLRVHRGAIVNMKVVQELNLSNQPTLVLKNEEQIPVSKSYLKVVKEYLS